MIFLVNKLFTLKFSIDLNSLIWFFSELPDQYKISYFENLITPIFLNGVKVKAKETIVFNIYNVHVHLFASL